MPSSTVYVVRGKPSKFYLRGKRISVDTAFGLYQKKANFLSFGVTTRSGARGQELAPVTKVGAKDRYADNMRILLAHYGRDLIVYKITEAGRTYHRFFYPSTGTGNPRFKGAYAGLFVPMYGYAQDGKLLKGGMQLHKQFPQNRSHMAYFPWQRNLLIHMLENSGALVKDIRMVGDFLSSYINTPGELSVTIDRHIDDDTQTDFLQTSSMKAEIKEWLQRHFVIHATDVTSQPLPPLENTPIYTTEEPSEEALQDVYLTAMPTRYNEERWYTQKSKGPAHFPVRQPWMDTMDSQ